MVKSLFYKAFVISCHGFLVKTAGSFKIWVWSKYEFFYQYFLERSQKVSHTTFGKRLSLWSKPDTQYCFIKFHTVEFRKCLAYVFLLLLLQNTTNTHFGNSLHSFFPPLSEAWRMWHIEGFNYCGDSLVTSFSYFWILVGRCIVVTFLNSKTVFCLDHLTRCCVFIPAQIFLMLFISYCKLSQIIFIVTF